MVDQVLFAVGDLIEYLPHLPLAEPRIVGRVIVFAVDTRDGGRQGEQSDEEHGQLHVVWIMCLRTRAMHGLAMAHQRVLVE